LGALIFQSWRECLPRSQRLFQLHPSAKIFLPAEQAAMIHEKAADTHAWMMPELDIDLQTAIVDGGL
jgi:hypothetical protein